MEFEFAKDWFEQGNKETRDIYRFFNYFIAFNWLYNQSQKGGDEFTRIHHFVKCFLEKHDNVSLAKSFLIENSELYKGVKNARTGKTTRDYKNNSLLKNEPANSYLVIFYTIYNVRCNLFHGSKSMMNDRNKKLIKESCEILFNVLNTLYDESKLGVDHAA